MKRKIAVLQVVAILTVVAVLGVGHVVLPDSDYLPGERRAPDTFPAFSFTKLGDDTYIKALEEYLQDQFPLRQTFRAQKAFVRLNILQFAENNDLFSYRGSICELEYPMMPTQVNYTARTMRSLVEAYFPNSNVYYAVLPTKADHAAPQLGYLQMDYDALVTQLRLDMPESMQYIPVYDQLSIDHYFTTDHHWRQETLLDFSAYLLARMGLADVTAPAYEAVEVPFYGAYAGQWALPLPQETLIYLQSDALEACTVRYGLEGEAAPMYYPEGLQGKDPYDVYLRGAVGLITIENPNAQSQRELILFRDSFSSSLAPLLCHAYRTVTLVDLRYFNSDQLPQYVDLHDQDVLFLYSTSLCNRGMLLK